MFKWSRSLLAIIYCALVFGIMAAPYGYIAFGLLTILPFGIASTVVLVLVTCTLILFFGLVTVPKTENTPLRYLRKIPAPLRIISILLSFACVSLLLVMMGFSDILADEIQDWYYLIQFAGIISCFTLSAVLLARPSKLERFLTLKFSKTNKFYIAYRAVACLLLCIMLAWIGVVLVQFHQFEIQSIGG